MAGPYATAAEVSDQVRSRLGNAPATLEPSFWDSVVSKAVRRGYQRILNALTKRGYSLAAIDQWVGRKDYNRDLAVAYAFLHRGFGNEDDRSALNKELDLLEKELDDPDLVLLSDAGALIAPDLDGTGGATTYGRSTTYDADLAAVEGW